MTETVTWLHISDTHFCEPKHNWDSEDIFESFFDDLEYMSEKHNLYPDLVFFTGDIAFGHIGSSSGLSLKDQYKKATEFLERVREIFPKILVPNIFIVPGNHDVNRTQILKSQTEWLESLRNNKQKDGRIIINKLIDDNDVEWKTFMKRLNDYEDFLLSSGYKHLLEDPDRLIYSIKLPVNGFEVGVAGLNSAWSSYGGDGDKAKLWLGAYQLSEARKKIKDAMFSIVISHHPPNWFTELEDPSIGRKIESNFNFYLHGHEHQEWVTVINKQIRIAAGALYNGSERENGYNFVKLYPFENKGEVFLRTYKNDKWIPNIIGMANNDGIWHLENLNIDIQKNRQFYSDKTSVISPATGMEFIKIVAGEFLMGSDESEEGSSKDERPVHKVIIKYPYYLGKYPVTQKQWKKLMGSNLSYSKGDDFPVEMVSWDDIQDFIKKLNDKEGVDKYRLPSEAEWEYVCRAGTQAKFSFNEDESKLDNYAWYEKNAWRDKDVAHETRPVSQKKPNPWGFYDMHGNVWEWVQDNWHQDYNGAPSDGSAWEDGNISYRVVRGGCWFNSTEDCRSASRQWINPKYKSNFLSFRLLREL